MNEESDMKTENKDKDVLEEQEKKDKIKAEKENLRELRDAYEDSWADTNMSAEEDNLDD